MKGLSFFLSVAKTAQRAQRRLPCKVSQGARDKSNNPRSEKTLMLLDLRG